MPVEEDGGVVAVIELAVQAGVNAGQVIALKIVVDVRFPVALHHVVAARVEAHIAEAKLLRLRRQFAEGDRKGLGMLVEIDENQPRPLLAADRPQSELRSVELLHTFEPRR